MNLEVIIAAVVGLLVGGGVVFAIWNTFLGKTYKNTLAEAEKAGEGNAGEKQGGASSSEDQKKMISISVRREGGRVKVKLDRNGETVAERDSSAQFGEFQEAMKFISEKLGRDVLKLK